MKIHTRIERLEDELLPLPAGPTLRLEVGGFDEEGKEVKKVFEIPQGPPVHRRRRYRGFAARGDW
jgi:hypothetical protein